MKIKSKIENRRYKRELFKQKKQGNKEYNFELKLEEALNSYKAAHYQEAVEKLKYLEINNNQFLVNWYLGHAYFKLFEYNLAIQSIKKSIQLKSKDVLNLNFLAELYKAINKYDLAILSLEESLKIDEKNKDTLINLAKIYTDKGNFKEAIKNYYLILENEPNNYGVYYELIKLKKDYLNESLIKKINQDLLLNNIDDENKMYANFILANNEKLNKNYKLQINHLLKSHKIFINKKKTALHQEWNYFSNLLPKFIVKNNQNTLKIFDTDEVRPIFIVGLPRSGTTLVENIISNGLMKLPMGGEIEPFSKVFYSKNIIRNYDSLSLKTNFNFKRNEYHLLKENILYHYNQSELINSKTKNTFTDKSLENFLYIDIIQKIFPKSKFIYCQRNPMANILGIFNNFLPNLLWTHSLETIFKFFDIYHKKLDEIKAKNNLNFKIINIEQISNEPKKISKDLYKFLELEWSDDCIDLKKNNNIIKTASNIQLREEITKHDLDYLKNYIDIFKDFEKKYNWFKY